MPEVRIGMSKSEAMVLSWKSMVELATLVEEFKHLRYLFMSEGRIKWKTDSWISAASAIMQMYWFDMVKRELSQKVKLSIYLFIYIPVLIYSL